MTESEMDPLSPLPTFTLQAMNNDIVLEKIISHLGDNIHALTKYRLVCRKWNDAFVRKINKSDHSLHIPLRYGPEIPLLMVQSEAQRWTKEILTTVSNTLTGSASRLLFDTVVVDRDFYLAGVIEEWKCFLEVHGASTRHIKFKIRSAEFSKPSENYVTDCEEIVSMENLATAFSATPNLESLYFSIRFSNYSSEPVTQPKIENLPLLQKLTKITFREPKGISYPPTLLTQVLGMTSNLTSLCIKPSSDFSAYASTMKSIEKDIKGSLTSLKISNAHFPVLNDSGDMIHFPYLNLTSLEINNCDGVGRHHWIEELLRVQRTSLVKLILGNRKNSRQLFTYEQLADDGHNIADLRLLRFQPGMVHLKELEVNLSKFRPFIYVPNRDSFQVNFPVLESFTLSGARENGHEWTSGHVMDLLLFSQYQSYTLKQFSLIGPIQDTSQHDIIMSAKMTFPLAECHFHSESDNQYSQKVHCLPTLTQRRNAMLDRNI